MAPTNTTEKPISRARTLLIFVSTILIGFVLFALPNVFFGVSKFNGGLIGVNLLWMALFQLVTVLLLLYYSLRLLNKDFRFIGLVSTAWKSDSVVGLLTGLAWTALQFGWIIPNTGGSAREDIAQGVAMMDGTLLGMLSYLTLGIIGGGITEEIYNRGYFITVLQDTFKRPQVGLWFASVLSIVFFALGHLPGSALDWFDILVPTVAYTILFLLTRRLTASIVAHSTYNATAILLTYYLYY